MGRKNFVEDYDPLRAHLTRDSERAASPPKQAPVVPAPARPAPTPPAARGVAPQRREEPTADAPSVEVSPRVKVSQAAFQDLEMMLSNLHRATGSQIHYSIATRALWGLLVQAEAQVLEELRKAGLGRLPSTREKLSYAEYEEHVKQAFARAFRKLPRSLFQPALAQETEPAGEG